MWLDNIPYITKKEWLKKKSDFFVESKLTDTKYNLLKELSLKNRDVSNRINAITCKVKTDLYEFKKSDFEKQKINIELDIDISKAENIKWLLDITISSIINKVLSNIESQWWISLSVDSIYIELILILDDIEKKLPENHIFKNDISILKHNFLFPPEVWKKMIQFFLNLMNWKQWENVTKDLEDWYFILRSWIKNIFDVAKIKTKDEIKNYILELKKIPIVKNYLDTIPNFENLLLNYLPNLINSIDKDKFIIYLDEFYNWTKSDFVKILDYRYWKWEIESNLKNKITLNIANKFSVLLWNIVNKKNSNQVLFILSNVDFIKNNWILNSIINLFNSSNINNTDKKKFIKNIINIFNMATQENISDEQFEDNIVLLFEEVLIIWVKFDIERLDNVIQEIQNLSLYKEEEESIFSKFKEKLTSFKKTIRDYELFKKTIWNTYDILKKSIKSVWDNSDFITDITKWIINFINDNKYELSRLAKKWIKYWVKKSEIFDYLLKKWVLKWKTDIFFQIFVKEMKNILNVDIKKFLVNLRDSYLNSTIKLDKFKYNDNEELANIINDNNWLIWKIVDKFTASWLGLFNERIWDKENNFITKKEVIELIITDLRDILSKNKWLVINFLKENWKINKFLKINWIDIDNKNEKKLFFDLIDWVINNPQLVSLISKIFTVFINKNKWNIDIKWDISKLLLDSFDSIKQNKWVLKEVSSIWIDLFYDKILSNRTNVDTFISIIKEKTWINLVINDKKILDIVQILKKYIKQDIIKKIYYNNQNLLEWNSLSKDKMINIMYNIYSKINNKTVFIKEIIDTWVVSDLKNIEFKKKKEKETNDKLTIINNDKLLKLNELIFDTLNEKNWYMIWEVINSLIRDFWLSDLLKINIWGQSLWQNIVLLLHSIGKEKFGSILTNNINLIKNSINIDFKDNNQVLSFVELWKEIISNIDVLYLKNILKNKKLSKEEILWMETLSWFKDTIKLNNYSINRLVQSWLDQHNTQNLKNIDMQKVTAQNIDDICSLIFDFLNYTCSDNVSHLINFYLDKLWFWQVLKLNILWRDFWNNLISFLKSIWEWKFSQVIKNNLWFLKQINKIPNLQKIIDSWEITIKNKDIFMGLSKFWRDLLIEIDLSEFNKWLDMKKLSKMEKLWLDLWKNVQDIISKNSSEINMVLSKWLDLFNLYNEDIKIKKWSIEAKKIQKYWEELFDLLNKIIKSFDEKKLKTYFNNEKIFWWEKRWKKGNKKNSLSSYNKFKSDFIWNFIQNNVFFTLKTLIKTVFDGLKINIWDFIDNYFRNIGNKDDFWDTLMDVFLNK